MTAARCSASSSPATAPKLSRRGSNALERDLAGSISLPLHARHRPGGAAAHLGAARGGARALDGDEGRREVDFVRRGHRGRARAAARLHRAVSADHQAARHRRRHLRARVGRLPARPSGRQSEDRRRRAAVRVDCQRRSPTSCSSSAARCRASMATASCAGRSRRRCSVPRSTRRFAR